MKDRIFRRENNMLADKTPKLPEKILKIEDFWFLTIKQLENDFFENFLPRIPNFYSNQTGPEDWVRCGD